MNDLVRSALTAGAFTLFLFVLFVVSYWAFRGFLPGSRVVEQALVAPSSLDENSAKLRLFYVDWCPYSKDALKKVRDLEELLKTLSYGGKRVAIDYVNCEVNKDECALYKVDGYPTYKLEISTKMYEYVGPASLESYRAFLVKALGKEVSTE